MYPLGRPIVARRLFLTALILSGVPAWSVGMSMQTPQQDLARTTAASSPETAVIHSSLRDIAAGTSLTVTGSSSSGKNTRRRPLGSVDLNATPPPNRSAFPTQKFRFKANVNRRVDKVLKKECKKAARAFGKPVKGFRTSASKSVVSHFGGRLIEQDPSPASTRNDKPVQAIRELWANINQTPRRSDRAWIQSATDHRWCDRLQRCDILHRVRVRRRFSEPGYIQRGKGTERDGSRRRRCRNCKCVRDEKGEVGQCAGKVPNGM
ncbi:unnamed protein product [Ectocarpus sp. 12 AP-2014]